jgi:hypothetical protein
MDKLDRFLIGMFFIITVGMFFAHGVMIYKLTSRQDAIQHEVQLHRAALNSDGWEFMETKIFTNAPTKMFPVSTDGPNKK